MHILFISTHSLATNPRLVKEIELALKNDFGVTVIAFSFENWSKSNNEKIKESLPHKLTYLEIPGNRTPFFTWFTSSLIFVLSKFLNFFSSKNVLLLSFTSNKRSWLLLQHLKKIKDNPDLVVAHNPGSFYPAMIFSKKNNIPFGIDLEDFHPGETTNALESKRLTLLLRGVLPKAIYISAASPSILSETEKIANIEKVAKEVVLNYFSSNEFQLPVSPHSKQLQLVWFSQNISYHRGLEQVVSALEDFPGIDLHLFGNCDEKFRKVWLEGRENIFVHKPLLQKELHLKLSEFDIGLAAEPGRDVNNELAISNKILAYFQAGLFILASDTLGQSELMEKKSGHGILTTLNEASLRTTFQQLIVQKDFIRKTAKERYASAKADCWENESVKLAELWSMAMAVPH